MRPLLFLLLALAVFVSVNIVTVRAMLHVHPRRRGWIIAAVVLGNLMWPFMLMVR